MKDSPMKMPAFVLVAAALGTSPAFAQQPKPSPMPMPMASSSSQSAADTQYMAAMDKMHKAMMMANDADPDRAFALKMIEHHRGAIAMSEVELKQGGDAEAKKMAQKIINDEKKSVAALQGWLDRHGGRTPKT